MNSNLVKGWTDGFRTEKEKITGPRLPNGSYPVHWERVTKRWVRIKTKDESSYLLGDEAEKALIKLEKLENLKSD